ncbi:MAG: LysR family transcriptional regulator [Gammaproteobacteria bacterium]|nr:LysR family transcriptional regulator [Gammaproteobacteria bacterium]
MRLDTESLRTLKAIVDSGSLTLVSRILSITPSAVSWKLKRLEQSVGRKLIHRDGHTIEPTADGKQLLSYAEIILSTHDEAVQQFCLSDLQGRIRIGITDDIVVKQLPKFIEGFQRRHPKVRLELKVEQQLTLLNWFDQRQIDVAVLPLEPHRIREEDTHLWDDELIWIKNKNVEYSLDGPVPLVTFSPNCTYRNAAIEMLNENGVDYYICMECPSLQGIRTIISSGMGVTLINRGLMDQSHSEWPQGEVFAMERKVTFIARATPLLPQRFREIIVNELKSALVENPKSSRKSQLL